MSCQCAYQPLCAACKKPIHRCRETAVAAVGGKQLHLKCWMRTISREKS